MIDDMTPFPMHSKAKIKFLLAEKRIATKSPKK